ncbi:tail fiber domain-containing protein [Adhaeribacter radiodurans]|uniref:Tail fiber domain-containing protein n=1 Tax=Adhaeribacter radiodurans TaxID=2745197 RepID=A0A7L7L524_9BACT|nr:tail fiber domain-containing protein [Adhaeribacter radiodurans]QMU27880.1 tail fiber domain-containing protein [Adhaeribacter radiodurans]
MKIDGKRVIAIAIVAFFSSISFSFAQQVPEQDLKKNVIPILNGLAYVQQLEPKMYQYDTRKFNKLNLPSGQQFGFLADEVQKVLPELVSSESQSYMVGKNTYRNSTLKNTDLESMIPLLVAAIKEQQKQIDELKRQLEASAK